MITHEQARRAVRLLNYDDNTSLLQDYIIQQAKKDKLLELYKEKSLILVEIMNMRNQTHNKLLDTKRYFEVLELIDELEEELK